MSIIANELSNSKDREVKLQESVGSTIHHVTSKPLRHEQSNNESTSHGALPRKTDFHTRKAPGVLVNGKDEHRPKSGAYRWPRTRPPLSCHMQGCTKDPRCTSPVR